MAETGAGKFRHLIWLQKATRMPDKVGQWTEVWSDDFPVWAAMWPTSASRLTRNERMEFEGQMRFRCWYNPGITYMHRIRYGERIFEINSIVVPDEARKYTDMVCTEKQDVS